MIRLPFRTFCGRPPANGSPYPSVATAFVTAARLSDVRPSVAPRIARCFLLRYRAQIWLCVNGFGPSLRLGDRGERFPEAFGAVALCETSDVVEDHVFASAVVKAAKLKVAVTVERATVKTRATIQRIKDLTTNLKTKLKNAGTSVVPADSKMGVVEEISLLLSDELDRLPELMDNLADHDDAVWAYLALAWVHVHQSEFDDPLETVDMIFADFGYPEDVGEFVTFMPPPTGGVPGVAGLKQRWQRYLDEKRSYFLNRSPQRNEN